jgi:hypothetical protein
MQISLKMGLPKLVLPSITMSRGGRLRFQPIEMVFQYAWLKAHSKKRDGSLFLHDVHYIGHNYSHLAPCFSFSIGLWCSIYLGEGAKTRIYVCLDCLRPTSMQREGRPLYYQSRVDKLSYCWSLDCPRSNSTYQ